MTSTVRPFRFCPFLESVRAHLFRWAIAIRRSPLVAIMIRLDVCCDRATPTHGPGLSDEDGASRPGPITPIHPHISQFQNWWVVSDPTSPWPTGSCTFRRAPSSDQPGWGSPVRTTFRRVDEQGRSTTCGHLIPQHRWDELESVPAPLKDSAATTFTAIGDSVPPRATLSPATGATLNPAGSIPLGCRSGLPTSCDLKSRRLVPGAPSLPVSSGPTGVFTR